MQRHLQTKKIIEKKCQCLPSPRFLRPGNAIQDEKASSSSSDVHSLSLGIFFLVNLIHSVPGFASSLKYNLGRALSISIPLRINKVRKIKLIKCAKRIQNGKSMFSMDTRRLYFLFYLKHLI
jgi:hypothetical protein